jgi:hypothetical protein
MTQFDFGAVRLPRAECERVGMHRPLVVTDAGHCHRTHPRIVTRDDYRDMPDASA